MREKKKQKMKKGRLQCRCCLFAIFLKALLKGTSKSAAIIISDTSLKNSLFLVILSLLHSPHLSCFLSFFRVFCSKLMDGLRCIDEFTYRCLDNEHRNYFNTLYQGTTQVIIDLCQEGAYQSGEEKMKISYARRGPNEKMRMKLGRWLSF